MTRSLGRVPDIHDGRQEQCKRRSENGEGMLGFITRSMSGYVKRYSRRMHAGETVRSRVGWVAQRTMMTR